MDVLNGAMDALRSIVGGVKQGEERREAGPGDVGPTLATRNNSTLIQLEMKPEEAKNWWREIKLSRERAKKRHDKWDILLAEYLPIISKSGEAETVKVMQHFRNVHSKIGQLFYRAPDLLLEPQDPSPLNTQIPNPMGQGLPPLTMADIVSVKQQVLKKKLGRDGIKATRLMDEMLFDALAWAGFGICKIGYRAVFKSVPEAPTQPGAVLGLQQPSVPVQVPMYEEWYGRRFSPKKALWNSDLRSTRFDEDATWMGMEFFMSPKRAMQTLQLSEEEANRAADDTLVYEYEEDKQARKSGLVRGIEIYAKGEFHVDGEVHPQAMYQIIFVEGIEDRPVVFRRSPDQTFDEMGRLTPDSLVGFPFEVLTLRDMADSSFIFADSAFTQPEIKQLTTFIRQSIQLRDADIGKTFVDVEKLTEEGRDAMRNGEVGAQIPVNSGALDNGPDKIAAPIPHLTRTADDYRGQQLIQSYIDMTLGVSATSSGAELDTVRSATEVTNMMSSMQGRNDKELHRALEVYLNIARKLDSLLMRYADEGEYVQIVGPDGAKKLQLWNKVLISGKYLYDMAPDSSVKIDTERDFDLDAKFWNLVAKSPLTNQEYVLRRLARKRGMDPDKAVRSAQQMEQGQKPEMRLSMALSGQDLMNPLVVKMLVDAGILQPQDVALNRPPEPPEGAADKADVLSKHEASNSGRSPNEPGARNFRDRQPGD